jgi:Sec-independent protein translocase protein TatA
VPTLALAALILIAGVTLLVIGIKKMRRGGM